MAAAARSQYVCDWGDSATGCTMQSLAPITCQKDGCDIPVHHVCQIGFEASINYEPPRCITNCRAHHEGYCNMMKNKQGAASSARLVLQGLIRDNIRILLPL